MAAQGESSHWRLRAPESSDSEPEWTEQFQTTEEESPPALQPPTPSRFTSSYQCVTGTGPRPGVMSPFSRWETPVQTPAITRTPSRSTQQLPTSVFVLIDLSELGLLPTNKTQQTVDEFNMLAANMFNPVTPTELIEPKNPMLPEQVTTNNMVKPPSTTQNGKGEKCQPPKDFDGKESNYKTWFRILEAYIRAYNNLFPDNQWKINCALTYMSSGRAAEWAEYFTYEHTKIVQGNRVFNPEMTWAEFVKLLDQNFDLRRTKDKARADLSVLKMKQGELKQYILNFNSLAGRGGYILVGQENLCLPGMFLDGLNLRLQDKIEDQKDAPKTLKDIIEDARRFEKSHYRKTMMRTKVMNWQPNRPSPRPVFTPQAHDTNAMDINRMSTMKKGLCFWCGQTGHMSCNHITNPALKTRKGNTSNPKKSVTPYKAIMPSTNKGSGATQKVCAIMAELNNEDLEEAKTAFLGSLDEDSVEEEPEGF